MTVPEVRDERPTYGVTAQVPPPKLPQDDRDTLKAYAALARWLYPGPVGEWIARDLEAIAEFGYRFATPSLLAELLAVLDFERDRRAKRVAEAARAASLAPQGPHIASTTSSTNGRAITYPHPGTFASGEHRPVPGATGSDGRP